MEQQIIDALSQHDIIARLWERGETRRLYLSRGEGRKRQDIGYLALDGEGRMIDNCATRNSAGIRDIVTEAGGRA